MIKLRMAGSKDIDPDTIFTVADEQADPDYHEAISQDGETKLFISAVEIARLQGKPVPAWEIVE